MTEDNVYVDNIDSKLKSLADLMEEVATHSPNLLANLLKDYRHFFKPEEHEREIVLSKSVDTFCQTDSVVETNPWNTKNITEDVTCIANKVTLETGFSYDHNSGWYYDHTTNCYYNSNYRLYYYNEHNAYYYYDEETKGLKFYSSVASESTSHNNTIPSEQDRNAFSMDDNNSLSEEDISINREPSKFEEYKDIRDGDPEKDKETIVFNPKRNIGTITGDDNPKQDKKCINDYPEESKEGSDVEEECIYDNPTPFVIEAGPTVFEPDNTKHFAPCIRIIVKSSTLPSLCNGTLFIITCTGGTIGREGDHDVLIPDFLVSKMHSKFQYVCKGGSYIYELIDLGSKNGTYVNGKRLSAPLVKSQPVSIIHGSIITVGHTDLLCHIHAYDETCSDCAPISNIGQENNSLESYATLKEQYNFETSLIKKKFGIDNYSVSKYPEGYEDRAEIRRKYVGSSDSSEKTETASVNEPMCKKNKGYALLSKMGWKEGERLGKRTEGALLEPIIPAERIQKNIGLGCNFIIGVESKKNSIMMKTLERLKQLSQLGFMHSFPYLVHEGFELACSLAYNLPCLPEKHGRSSEYFHLHEISSFINLFITGTWNVCI